MVNLFLGIDSGLNGGLTVMDSDGDIIEMTPMPTNMVRLKTVNKKTKKPKVQKNIDVDDFDFFMRKYHNSHVFIEHVTSFFGIDANTNFRLGYSIGVIHGIIKSHGIPMTLLKPKEWQERIWIDSDRVKMKNPRKEIKQSKNDPKATSLKAAIRLWDIERFILPRCKTPHDGMIDSTLIAEVGRHL